jgi:glycosyltransferase involved in cell wall biosynthesis
MEKSQKIGIFIPAFNEEESIIAVLDKLTKINETIPVYVIDDGSNDLTARVIVNHGFTCIRHPVNLGGGAAIKTAFMVALNLGYKYVITLDADGQHDPKLIPLFIETMNNSDAGLVIGSRFHDKTTVSMKKYRETGIRFFSKYTTLITGQKITDVTNCYRMYDMDIISEIINNLNENQYYAIGLVVKIARRGEKIIEIGIKDIPRTDGDSKKGVLRYLYNLLRIIINMTFTN